jgi:hypothetical protein
MRLKASLVALAFSCLGSTQALACTLCHSRISEDVRAAVFGPDLWSNVAALLAPMPVLTIAVLLVRKISP